MLVTPNVCTLARFPSAPAGVVLQWQQFDGEGCSAAIYAVADSITAAAHLPLRIERCPLTVAFPVAALGLDCAEFRHGRCVATALGGLFERLPVGLLALVAAAARLQKLSGHLGAAPVAVAIVRHAQLRRAALPANFLCKVIPGNGALNSVALDSCAAAGASWLRLDLGLALCMERAGVGYRWAIGAGLAVVAVVPYVALTARAVRRLHGGSAYLSQRRVAFDEQHDGQRETV